MKKTYGIIDIGSNTIRMNIYLIDEDDRDSFISVLDSKSAAGLAAYIENGALSASGIEKLIDTLKRFKLTLESFHINGYSVFATASLRNISNTQQVIDQVQKETDMKIDLLSGSEEGRLSMDGAIAYLKNPEGVYIDSGGGSTEVVQYQNGEILRVGSMPVGSLNLFTGYVSSILPTESETQRILKKVTHEIRKIYPERDSIQSDFLAVTGGSMRAVRDVLCELKWIRPDQYIFSAALLEQLEQFLSRDQKETIHLFLKVKPERIHTLYGGLLIAVAVSNYIHAKTIQICTHGIREGYLKSHILDQNLLFEQA